MLYTVSVDWKTSEVLQKPSVTSSKNRGNFHSMVLFCASHALSVFIFCDILECYQRFLNEFLIFKAPLPFFQSQAMKTVTERVKLLFVTQGCNPDTHTRNSSVPSISIDNPSPITHTKASHVASRGTRVSK
ncbi:hypothetical protein B9Z55_026228 [Caenorhabditis nigoni]|uniref:Uncharacterized protein n=1 Tax=Caenorhabditis nigoni TaxID=1611254 RepID=A0A2G5T2F0_9PELO|nr:hypothetical protein B9Z55_026228 [Caenorhabditis nigoni]